MYILNDNAGKLGASPHRQRLCYENRSCLRAVKIGQVFGISKETEVLRPGSVQRRHIDQLGIGLTLEGARNQPGDFRCLQRRAGQLPGFFGAAGAVFSFARIASVTSRVESAEMIDRAAASKMTEIPCSLR